jgi:hypothetical protein
MERGILHGSTSSGYGDPYDRRCREGVTRWTSGWRRRGRGGGGATGVVVDVGGAASGGGTAGVGVGSIDVVGTSTGFSADTGIFDVVSSSTDTESTSLLNPTSFPSLVLATDNEVCDNAGEPACVGVSVVSVTLEDGTLEFVKEAQATP